ncbi:MAG: hypothetical protein ACR2MA_08630 [Egibacteraceae bacterium]
MRTLTSKAPTEEGRLPFGRLLVLGAALLASQFIAFGQSGIAVPSVASAAALTSTALVVWRLSLVVGERERASRRAQAAAVRVRSQAEQQAAVAALGELATSDVDTDALSAEILATLRRVLASSAQGVELVTCGAEVGRGRRVGMATPDGGETYRCGPVHDPAMAVRIVVHSVAAVLGGGCGGGRRTGRPSIERSTTS